MQVVIEDNAVCAPIVIPTCNRYEHLKECVESLAKCTHAEKTELYISVDSPPDDSYREGWEKINSYVQQIRGGVQKSTLVFSGKESRCACEWLFCHRQSF